MDKPTFSVRHFPEGVKKTLPRLCICQIFEQAGRPLTANDLYQQARLLLPLNFSTVYRTLELLLSVGYLERHLYLDDAMAAYTLAKQHTHYAICLDCHDKIPVRHCPIEDVTLSAAEADFHVTSHKIELYGYCRKCSPKHGADIAAAKTKVHDQKEFNT
ncbi:MAG: Fur family transcriptional regulator [Lachnospiraceae bacterium]|nr:Fur family transcriptional regulator [Lachnospiraceae bacterium]MDY5741466.1 Fur family transcriptional regulator [Lachnospiraceae bacterium]